ncbi:MAG TPA: Wzz/FepE/Etk N-terminal domain-containing protein [Bryobacteraceae bacterium]|nr:Wzz/FepE/Etk N-terminal domain-containing protein [Bryobacteraceae bacterium]
MFPATGERAHPELSPLSLARMLWKSRLLIGLIWIFLCLLAGAVVYSIPPMYKAEAVILVDSQKVPERFVTSTVNSDVQDRLAAISESILSSNRLHRIILTYHLYQHESSRMSPEEVIEQMRKDTRVTLERGWSQDRTTAFRISFQGRNPTTVAEVANQIGNLFIEENLRTRENHAEGTSEFIESQVKQAQKTLNDLEIRVEEYKLQHKGELPEQQNSLAAELSRAQIELQGNQDTINRAEQSKALLSSSLSMAESTARVLERTAAQTSALAPGAKSAEALQAELDALRLRYTEDHPDVQRLEKLLAQAKKTERPPAASTAVSPELLQQRERIAQLKTELALAGREVDYRTADRQRMLAAAAALQARMDSLPIREQELTALTRDYEIAKANYKSLLDKRISADMATDMERRQQGERFTMIDPAQAPVKPFAPDRGAWFGGCCGAALLAAIAAGVAREIKRNVLLGEWELPPDIPILGRIEAIQAER